MLAVALLIAPAYGKEPYSTDGNRLAYLDGPCDPYYVGRHFPKLVTPQWVGEEGVDAVVVLAIDDMRDTAKYEAYLRPILDRLKKIDGRAAVSIMACDVKPDDPQLQKWLAEGLSIECHTVDHPCPLLQGGDFAKAKSTYDRCVDLMASIPGNKPVAFRTPCCDSLNTPSPRMYAEIVHRPTGKWNYLRIDSSVFNIFTPNDPELPREIVLENGKERFRKYVPFKSFVNTIEDYPYPYKIGSTCWQFPCVVPSDWQAQNIQRPNNPKTVEDMKLALDATVIKQGVFNLVFHPHGWIRAEQIVELIDYAQKKYGKRVKFLNFREALERLEKNLLARVRQKRFIHSHLLDINNDGFLDAMRQSSGHIETHIWSPGDRKWKASELRGEIGSPLACVRNARPAVAIFRGLKGSGVEYRDGEWTEAPNLFRGLEGELRTLVPYRPWPYQFLFRDIDGDGSCECLIQGENVDVWRFNARAASWTKLPFSTPDGAKLFELDTNDTGLRLVNLDEDGDLDLIFSNEKEFGAYLFTDMKSGWSKKLRAGKRGDKGAIPAISREGTNNGAFFHSRHLWVQNEDTARMPDLVDRVSFNDLLGDAPAGPKSPKAAMKTFRVRPGFVIEQVAAEPLVMDPVAIDWGPDGKLWVVEMADYPEDSPDAEKAGGRVRFLEDTDGDGRYDKSTVLLDELSHPNGVMAWGKGVLVTSAPDLIYAEDTDGDGKADKREVLFTGFTQGNPQHCVNGPAWGLDNWVYLANGDSGGRVRSKIRPDDKPVEISGRDLRVRLQPGHRDHGRVDAQAGMTQFGRARNDWGDWFGCNNPNPIWHYVLADHYIRRNQNVIAPEPRRPLGRDRTIDRVFPASRTLARFNDLHTANRFTSCCGLAMYRDELFGPEFAGAWFICEPVHNLVHRGWMKAEGCGFTAGRPDDEEDREFLASTDNWFRPTMARTGPDGALWITDMYRAVIEHPEWIPDDWEKKLDLRAGHDKGRIYRVYPVGKPPRPIERLDRLDAAGLAARLDSPNGTLRDLAHRMLVARGDRAAAAALEKLARDCDRAVTRLHALCALDGMDKLKAETLAAALADPHPGVRRHTVRLCEGRFDNSPAIAAAVAKLVEDFPRDTATADPQASESQVLMQLGYSLGEWNDPRAGKLLGTLLARHAEDEYISAAAMSSVRRENVDVVLATVLAAPAARGRSDRLTSRLIALSAALGEGDAIARAIEIVTRESDDDAAWRMGALAGVLDELDRQRIALDAVEGVSERAKKRVASMIAAARNAAQDERSSDEARLAAARLLGREASQRDSDIAILAALVAPHVPAALQEAAIHGLARIDNPRVAEALLAGWQSYTPALRRAVLDAIFSRDAWIARLLAAIEKGDVNRAEIDAARRQRLASHGDAGLRERASKLFASSGDANRAQVVEQHRDVLELAGDATRGSAVFAAKCAACHRLGGVGHELGADLAAMTDRSAAALLVALLDPNRAVEDKFIAYAVRTADGRQLSGILASETGSSITVASQDGKQETLLRADIEEIKTTGKSFMPEGLEKDLSRQQMADVIAYLAKLGPAAKQFEGNRPATVTAAADGSLVLSASQAAIYGPSLVFEQKYRNLGYWTAAADHAAWTIVVPKGARYRVTIDYACDRGSAGNVLAIEAAGARLVARIEASGTWDDYQKRTIGTIDVAAGEHRLVARPEGEPAGAVLDLRTIRLDRVN